MITSRSEFILKIAFGTRKRVRCLTCLRDGIPRIEGLQGRQGFEGHIFAEHPREVSSSSLNDVSGSGKHGNSGVLKLSSAEPGKGLIGPKTGKTKWVEGLERHCASCHIIDLSHAQRRGRLSGSGSERRSAGSKSKDKTGNLHDDFSTVGVPKGNATILLPEGEPYHTILDERVGIQRHGEDRAIATSTWPTFVKNRCLCFFKRSHKNARYQRYLATFRFSRPKWLVPRGMPRSSGFIPDACRYTNLNFGSLVFVVSAVTFSTSYTWQSKPVRWTDCQKPSVMKFTSATVAALLLTNTDLAGAFSVRPAITTNTLQHASASQQRLSALNFAEISGGIEELQELTEDKRANAFEKQVRKSPSFWKLAGYASIPVSAALGFGLVPSRRLVAHAAGALVTGVAGAIGKSRLDLITESAATPAIAQAIIDHGIEDPVTTNGYIRGIQTQFCVVDDEEFEAMCANVYGKYLLGMVKFNPVTKTSEPKELENLKAALGLSNLMVGEAHAAAATEWYRTTCLFTPEEDLDDPDHPDRQAMDKFIFLTERALSRGEETPEAFKFEMTRVAKAMNLSLMEAMDRVTEVNEPFYQRALKSTRAKLGTGQVSHSTLEKARQSLGISDETAFDMHVACLNEEVRNLLGLENEEDGASVDTATAKFSEGARERVSENNQTWPPMPVHVIF